MHNLDAFLVRSTLMEHVRALHHADALMFDQAMRVERRLSIDMLKESCERYRKGQMHSQLVGIALQIIPVVAGSLASVGISEEMPARNVADFSYELGSRFPENGMSSLGDRVFGQAALALSAESISKMDRNVFRRMEQALLASGLSVHGLRDHFNKGVVPGKHVQVEEIRAFGKKAAESAPALKLDHSGEQTDVQEPPIAALKHKSLDLKTNASVSFEKPSRLMNFTIEESSIANLNYGEIAALWAAFIVRFDDESMDQFWNFRDRISSVLKANHLDGALIVDRDSLSAQELAATIVGGLNNDNGDPVSVGIRARLKQFINSIS